MVNRRHCVVRVKMCRCWVCQDGQRQWRRLSAASGCDGLGAVKGIWEGLSQRIRGQRADRVWLTLGTWRARVHGWCRRRRLSQKVGLDQVITRCRKHLMGRRAEDMDAKHVLTSVSQLWQDMHEGLLIWSLSKGWVVWWFEPQNYGMMAFGRDLRTRHERFSGLGLKTIGDGFDRFGPQNWEVSHVVKFRSLHRWKQSRENYRW
jgi:hypothetical protein